MQQQLQDRDERLEEMRDALAEAARQREALQQKHGEEMQSAALERQRMAEQYAGNERHMLNEVDRARQELAAARKAAGEQERKAAARQAEVQARYEKSEQEQLDLHSQLQTARNAAALAQERAADLRSLLEAQQRLSGTMVEEGGAALSRRSSLSAARRSMTRLKDRRGSR
jgi:chromosome segregation ATPase